MTSQHSSSLQPIMIPDLGYFLDPLSPSDSGYSSPAGSDTIQTPFIEHHDHHVCFDPPDPHLGQSEVRSRHVQDELVSKRILEPLATSPLPQVYVQSSPAMEIPQYHDHSLPSSPLTPPFDYESSPIESGPFASSFSAGYNSEPNTGSSPAMRHARPFARSSSCDTRIQGERASVPMPAPKSFLNLKARAHSLQFPAEHKLNPYFVHTYELEDELGSGGYGFVMTAHHRTEGHEVAVKFIIKAKVPEHAWTVNETIGRLPTEVMLLSYIHHENIVKCLDLFEDSLYFYLVQELHGSPWPKAERLNPKKPITVSRPSVPSITLSLPSLSPSASEDSIIIDLEPTTPPPSYSNLDGSNYAPPHTQGSQQLKHRQLHCDINFEQHPEPSDQTCLAKPGVRPEFNRRPSHDLFECIEQSEHRRLEEDQARYVFAQVVEAVHYLDEQGVTHRDLKDENIVIDKDFKVKLIDFGSAIVVNTSKPRPYYDLFFGTAAYASSEILLKKPYQAPPAEIWTLGVLLSYLLTGMSPFPSVKDAIEGRIVLTDVPGARLSSDSLSLMRRCLDPDPGNRATIAEVRSHRWLGLP